MEELIQEIAGATEETKNYFPQLLRFNDTELDTLKNKVCCSTSIREGLNLNISVIGLIKSGKSMTMNCLFGNGNCFLVSNTLPETACITWIQHHSHPFSMIEHISLRKDIKQDIETETNETIIIGPNNIHNEIKRVNDQFRRDLETKNQEELTIPELVIRTPVPCLSQIQGVTISAADSPGANESKIPTIRNRVNNLIVESDIIIYVLDATQLGSNDEQKLLADLAACSPAILQRIGTRGIFVLNKMDRVTGITIDAVKTYVQNFLQRSLVSDDGSPVEIPLHRIIPISAFQGFLGLNARCSGSDDIMKMREVDRNSLLQQIFGRTIPPLHEINARITECISSFIEESGIPQLQSQLQQFLHENAIPLVLESHVARNITFINQANNIIARKKHCMSLSSQELELRISQMEQHLNEAKMDDEFQEIMQRYDNLRERLTQQVQQWVNNCITESQSQPPQIQEEFPTSNAAITTARRLVNEFQVKWLGKVIPEQTTMINSVQREIIASQSIALDPFIQKSTALLNYLYKGEERGQHEGQINQIRQGLTQSAADVSIPPLNMGNSTYSDISNSIKNSMKNETWTEQVPEMVNEYYYVPVTITHHHKKKRWYGKVKHWTTTTTQNEQRVRSVLKYKTVQKQRSVNIYLLQHAVVHTMVATECRKLVENQSQQLIASIHNAINSRKEQAARSFDILAQFTDSLRNDMQQTTLSKQQKEELLALYINAEQILMTQRTKLENLKSRINQAQFPIVPPPVTIPVMIPENTVREINDSLQATTILQSSSHLVQQVSCVRNCIWRRLLLLVDRVLDVAVSNQASEETLAELATIRISLRSSVIRICVVGLMKVGKSTTLNALVEKKIVPSNILPETAQCTQFEHIPFSSLEIGTQKYSVPVLVDRNIVPEWSTVQGSNHNLFSFDSFGIINEEYAHAILAEGVTDVYNVLELKNSEARAQSGDERRTNVVLTPIPMAIRYADGYWSSLPICVVDTPGPNEAFLPKENLATSRELMLSSDIMIYVVDANRMFQDDETEVLAHLHCWFDRILSATARSNLNQPLPILFAINKMDLVILNEKMDMEQFKNRIHSWLITQLEDVLKNNENARDCNASSLLPKQKLIFFSAQNAWLGLSVRNGNCNEHIIREIMDYMWGRNLPSTTENAAGNFGEAVDLVTSESNADQFFTSTMDMVVQNIFPVVESVLQEVVRHFEDLLVQFPNEELCVLFEELGDLQASVGLFANK